MKYIGSINRSFVETSRLLNSVRTPLEDLSITEIE
jgi:hypothetical protein